MKNNHSLLKKLKQVVSIMSLSLLPISYANALSIWHSDTVYVNNGICSASFTLDSGGEHYQQLELHLVALEKSPSQLLTQSFLSVEDFGGLGVQRYGGVFWESEIACEQDIELIIAGATAVVNGQKRNLIADNTLLVRDFVPFSMSIDGSLFDEFERPATCLVPKFTITALIQDEDGYTNVRSQPNAQSTVIEKVFDNELFYTFEQKGNWWQVCTPTGQIGYMYHNRIAIQ